MEFDYTLTIRKCKFVEKKTKIEREGIEIWHRGFDAVCISDGFFYPNEDIYPRTIIPGDDFDIRINKIVN